MVQEIQVKGILKRQESGTHWEYGSFFIEQNGFAYALTSDQLDLGKCEGEHVVLSGRIVEGYPPSGSDGPSCLNVMKVRSL